MLLDESQSSKGDVRWVQSLLKLFKEHSSLLQDASPVELRHAFSLLEETPPAPISGPFFPLDPKCSACSGLLGSRSFTSTSSACLWTLLAMPQILRNSVSILLIVFLFTPTFTSFLTAEIWFWHWTKSNFTPSPSLLQFWKLGFLQDGNFVLVSRFWQNCCEFWLRRSQQATRAALWTLDWEGIRRGKAHQGLAQCGNWHSKICDRNKEQDPAAQSQGVTQRFPSTAWQSVVTAVSL